jgi:L-fucose isomerase-like protein
MTFSIIYLPIARKTFDLDAANAVHSQTSAWLGTLGAQVLEPEGLLTSVEEMEAFLNLHRDKTVDAIVYQSVTFADGEFVARASELRSEPVIVWSVREPSVGGRLRLNSLTGGNSTSNVLMNLRRPFAFVFGNPDEERLQRLIMKEIRVCRAMMRLRGLTVGVVGDHPPGFFFSGADEKQLEQLLGARIIKLDLQEAFRESIKLEEPAWQAAVERAEKQVVGLNRSDESVRKFAQFYTYIENRIKGQGVEAMAFRCWPEFFNDFGAAACSTLSQFTEIGIVSACESDIHGSISMFLLRELSGGLAPYLGDLVHVDEERNAFVFWHCGAGAFSLANPATGAVAGVHPNRKMGFAMDFGLKAGGVTLFRLSSTPDGLRLIIMKGEALDVPQPFSGTSVTVQMPGDVLSLLDKIMLAGAEPHFAMVYDDVAEELAELGRMLGIPVFYLS